MLTLRAAKQRVSDASASEPFSLDVEIEQEEGRTLVVVGESGAGKTTLLRLLAGLEKPDRGHIALGGETWFDEPRTGGTWVPPWARSIGYVGQDYALFPHLTVRENVAFGLDARGWSRPDLKDRPAAVLDEGEVTHGANLPAGVYEARRPWRRIRRRSFSVAPPHTPSFSRTWRANSRQVSRTVHTVQTAFASSKASTTSSACDG